MAGVRAARPPVVPEDSWGEREFQRWLTALARGNGWEVRTAPPIKNSVVKDWPDVTLVHPTRGFLFVEVKAAKGQLRPGQVRIIDLLERAHVEVYVWRPADHESARWRLTR